MKKTILLTIAVLFSITANAQYELTPQGVINTVNPEAEFFTKDFEGRTAEKLYNATLVHITKMFVSAKDVISKVDNEAININGAGSIIAKNAAGVKSGFRMTFSMSIQFKDNRVRFNDPSIISITENIGTNILVYQGGSAIIGIVSIFNKKGEIKNELAKQSIEQFFNSFVSDIEASIKDSDGENW